MANEFSTVDTLQAAMTFHRERHTVLAGNVANVDTPGYRPLDLKRHEHTGGGLEMAATESSEGASASGTISTAAPDDYTTAFDDGGSLQGPDGNAVSIERELSKIDANRTRYETASELVSRRLALLKYAAGDGT